MKYVVLKKLELTAGSMLRQKAISDRMRRPDERQQTETARLQSKVKYHEKPASSRSTAVFFEESGRDERDRAGSSDTRTGEGSPRDPESKFSRKG